MAGTPLGSAEATCESGGGDGAWAFTLRLPQLQPMRQSSRLVPASIGGFSVVATSVIGQFVHCDSNDTYRGANRERGCSH